MSKPKKFTHAMGRRLSALLPHGVPKYIRAYDNGGLDVPGGSGDRFTVCFTGKAGACRAPGCATEYSYRAMNCAPFHPQGIGMWGSTKNQPSDTMREKPGWHWPPAIGRKCHLGRRIRFQDLPPDCRKLVLSDYLEIWKLKP